jgi:hypothetical protein
VHRILRRQKESFAMATLGDEHWRQRFRKMEIYTKVIGKMTCVMDMELKNMEELEETKKQKRMEAILDQQLFMKNL